VTPSDRALARLTKGAIEVSGFDRPDAPRGTVTYRCGHVIYVRRSDWRAACTDRPHPTASCLCHKLGVPLKAVKAEGVIQFSEATL